MAGSRFTAGGRMTRDTFNHLHLSSHTAETLADVVVYGPPILCAAGAFLLARRGVDWAASICLAFFAGLALLVSGFMIGDVAEIIGPLVLAAIPYLMILAGAAFAGAT